MRPGGQDSEYQLVAYHTFLTLSTSWNMHSLGSLDSQCTTSSCVPYREEKGERSNGESILRTPRCVSMEIVGLGAVETWRIKAKE